MTSEPEQIYSEALRLSTSDLSDDALKRMLVESFGRDPEQLETALNKLSVRTPNYAYDRAGRILRAMLDDGPVAPVDEEHAELFEWERTLDHMPLAEAYAELSALEPRLTGLPEQARAWGIKADKSRLAAVHRIRGVNRMSDAVDRLVGPGSAADDPRLRSSVSVKVATNHLVALVGVGVGG